MEIGSSAPSWPVTGLVVATAIYKMLNDFFYPNQLYKFSIGNIMEESLMSILSKFVNHKKDFPDGV
jgi:hypothetical protein